MHYILKDKEAVPCELLEWAKWFGTNDRTVAKNKFGKVLVSTVFIGLDHSLGIESRPLIFETMVFGGPLNQEMDRYSTWNEAVAGHEIMCARVKGTKS